MTYVITEPCIDVKDKTCAGECPVASICEGERLLCIRSGERVGCDADEPACPVEAIFYEHGVPGRRVQFTTENVRLSGQLGSPGGASRAGPLRYDTDHVTSRCRRGGQAHRGARRPTKGGGNLHRYRLEVRLTAADAGKRVVIRWRRPGPGDGEQIADVLGILEEADAGSFAVRIRDGRLVVVSHGRAPAGEVVLPPPVRQRRAGPKPP